MPVDAAHERGDLRLRSGICIPTFRPDSFWRRNAWAKRGGQV